MAVEYNIAKIVTDGLVLAFDAANPKSFNNAVFGQMDYTTAGTYSWTCPAGVTSVSVVCIGGGGGGNGGGNGVGGAGGGGGGGLGYKNNISVTPGQSYTVVVGGGGAGDAWDGPPYSDNPANDGGDSYFIDATTVKGGGGGGGYGNSSATGGSGGTYVGDGGGNGYSGGTGSSGSSSNGYLPATGGGGGSTGTYTGNATTRGTAKSISSNCTSGCLAGNGTGQGVLGTIGGGDYGRGGGANMNTFSNGTSGYTGAVRIMWGPGRSYPSTNVYPQYASTAFNDMSGKSNNGTLTGGTAYSSLDDGAIIFDGSNDHVVISDNSDFSFGSGEFAIEVWFRPDSFATVSTSTYYAVLSCGFPAQLYWVNNQFQFYASTTNSGPYFISGSDFNSGSNSAARGVWHHIVVTRTGNDFKMYLNGELVDSESNSSSFGDPNTDTTIGATNYSGISHAVKGKISNVRIYKGKGLTAAEVLQNFNALKGRFGI